MNAHTNANPLEPGNDELVRYALEECIKRQRIDRRITALVMPAGRCKLAGKLARLGAQVTVLDQPECAPDIQGRILATGLNDEISFAAGMPPNVPEELEGEPYDIIIIRRGLSVMPYDQARAVLRQLLFRLKIGGKMYVSVLGLHTELGEGYAAAEAPIESRFAPLAPLLAKKYGIDAPLCLYTERNLFMLLLESGASVLRTMTTTYGNVRGIAVRV